MLASAALSYFKVHQRPPTSTAVMQELRERQDAGRLSQSDRKACVDYLVAASNRPAIASDYAVHLILSCEKREAMWAAIEEATRLHSQDKIDDIARVIGRADSIGKVDLDLGVDFGADIDRRTGLRENNVRPRRWGTGIPELDELLDGGPSLENPLACVEAGPKRGKSLFLAHVALNVAALGGVCAFFSIENGKEEVLKRMDAAISGVAIKEVHGRAREVDAAVKRWVASYPGVLHVRKFPQGTTRVADIEAYLDSIALELDLRPDVVVVDYPKEMAVNEPGKFGKRYEELEEIYRALRTMAERRRVVTWTAAQLTKEGLDRKIAATGDTGGAFAIEQIVDVMVAIGRTEEEIRQDRVRFGITASRFCRDAETTGQIASAFDMGRIVADFIPGWRA